MGRTQAEPLLLRGYWLVRAVDVLGAFGLIAFGVALAPAVPMSDPGPVVFFCALLGALFVLAGIALYRSFTFLLIHLAGIVIHRPFRP